ncbi:hypothetical protein [Gynuella sunshinyii]|uniref:Uncharacterized protein n=1 Tax=Gynuella sunshinyii YC6258 TaxID=1445510 RepID=A0A0C5VJA3_9GAMM|nr:hypothetical protein [Gynuella sunshinyii]AJQ94717.1 hypothetical Protein YC6258_02679 [Gynuella sunshinyii YC6258]
MKINAVWMILWVGLLTACNASLPAREETEGAIFVVPTEFQKHQNAEYLKSFWLDFEPVGPGEPFRVIVNPLDGRNMVVKTGVQPGTYLLTRFNLHSMNKKGWDASRDDRSWEVNMRVEIAEDSLTVWNHKLIYHIDKSGGRSYQEQFNLLPLDLPLKQQIQVELENMNADSRWPIIFLTD